MATHIALLRAVNLGGRRRVGMAQLRELLGAAGYAGVRTHLQSGNVLLDSDEAPDRVAADLSERIGAAFGFDVPVVVRTRDELAALVDRDPLAGIATDPKLHQVLFLAAEPPPEVAEDLGRLDVAPEVLVVDGREVHAWQPGGIRRSRLGRHLADERLGTGTARNWRTVTALLELAAG